MLTGYREYIVPGDKLLFREGRTKGLGVIKQVGYDYSKPLNPNSTKIAEGELDARARKDSKAEKYAARHKNAGGGAAGAADGESHYKLDNTAAGDKLEYKTKTDGKSKTPAKATTTTAGSATKT